MFEKILRKAPLVEPSAEFDLKIRALIEESGYNRKRSLGQSVPLWMSAVACIIFALLGFFASQWTRNMTPQSEPEQILIYIMEPTEASRNLLLREDNKTRQNFFQTKKSNIDIVTPRNVSNKSLSF